MIIGIFKEMNVIEFISAMRAPTIRAPETSKPIMGLTSLSI